MTQSPLLQLAALAVAIALIHLRYRGRPGRPWSIANLREIAASIVVTAAALALASGGRGCAPSQDADAYAEHSLPADPDPLARSR